MSETAAEGARQLQEELAQHTRRGAAVDVVGLGGMEDGRILGIMIGGKVPETGDLRVVWGTATTRVEITLKAVVKS